MKEEDKTNGGNGKKVSQEKPKSVEQRQASSLQSRKGQYFALALIKILNIKPAVKENCSMFLEFDELVYDLGEIFEKAVNQING